MRGWDLLTRNKVTQHWQFKGTLWCFIAHGKAAVRCHHRDPIMVKDDPSSIRLAAIDRVKEHIEHLNNILKELQDD